MTVGLLQAFRLAAAELGMASASWLFVQQTAAEGGDEAVARLRDQLGREWPVLDAVCAGWRDGARAPRVDAEAMAARLQGAARLVLVGHEATWVDALLPQLPSALSVGLVPAGDPLADTARLLANHGGRVQGLTLADFQTWAGPRSVLASFVYGASGQQVFVLPAWLRATGPDVRLQFRSLIGWRVLDLPLAIYPRWLVAADVQTLTEQVPAT